MFEDARIARLKDILAAVKPLASEYYQITKKPLGVTGELAEFIVAEKLGLELVGAREPGYDAIRRNGKQIEKIQIKGRALDDGSRRSQRLGSIKRGAACDTVILALLDSRTLDPVGMWEASYSDVIAHLEEPGSRARNERGSMSVNAFKRIGKPISFE